MTIKVTVWGENVHEQKNKIVRDIYPDGMHNTIRDALNKEDGIEAQSVTLQDHEQGITDDILDNTDVMTWWGHAAHGDVRDDLVEKIVERVWGGMGMIFLHSAHFSKPFKRLMGTPCNLKWREAGERERLWVTAPNHPIVAGLGDGFTLEHEEMYGEPFGIPEPLETVMIGWFQGGEVFRSGVTYRRGAGNLFYFQPGHETYKSYHDENVQRVIANGVRWAHNPAKRIPEPTKAPNVPVHEAPEKIEERGPRLHQDGEEGFR